VGIVLFSDSIELFYLFMNTFSSSPSMQIHGA
jgi:hypothetical protein